MHHLLKIVIVIFAVQAIATHSFAQEKKEKKTELEGVWVYVSVIFDGKEKIITDKSKELNHLLRFKGNNFYGSKDGKLSGGVGVFNIDPSKNPKEINLLADGDYSLKAIYKLEGDTFTFCFLPESLNLRPKKFVSSKEKTALFKLNRAKIDVPSLIVGLKDRDNKVRRDAVNMLGIMGPEAKEAIPALIHVLKDKDPLVRRSTVHALGLIGPVAKEVMPSLIAALVDKDPFLRRNAAAST